MSIENVPQVFQDFYLKIPNGMIDLSEKYNSSLNLVYIYLIINRNMIGKTNVAISDIQKDIFKVKNPTTVKKKLDEILDSYYILSNSITKEDGTVAINDLITIENQEKYFDFGELNYETLNDFIKNTKESCSIKNINQVRFSIIPKEYKESSFTKLYLKEYLTLMGFLYDSNIKAKKENKNSYKIENLFNLYLIIKEYISKNTAYNNKFKNNRNPTCFFIDKLEKKSSLSRVTLNKYLKGLCECGLIERHKKDTKVYYKLTHKEFI